MSDLDPWPATRDDAQESDCGSPRSLRPQRASGRRRHRATSDADTDRRLSRLATTIELEVIPRLMLAHGTAALVERSVTGAPIELPDTLVGELSGMALLGDTAAAQAMISGLHSAGARPESLLLDLLAPTARHLGHLWHEDLCTFAEVTVALSILQTLLREIGRGFTQDAPAHADAKRIVLAPLRGEQHTFGIFIVEEFFHRAGWHVIGGGPAQPIPASQIVAKEWAHIVGISTSGEPMLERLEEEIKAVRRNSRNREVTIMVGGSLFNHRPDLARKVGADCTAVDGKLAVVHASAAVTARA